MVDTCAGLSFSGQPQDHHKNKCNSGQPSYQVYVKLMECLFGPDIPSVEGKTTRCHPHQLVSNVVSIPHELCDAQCYIYLYIDIMYINGMPFLTTISKNIKCCTAVWVADCTAPPTITALVESVINYINRLAFKSQ